VTSPEARTVARGIGALAAIDALSRTPPTEQVHPALQEVIAELCADVGRHLRAVAGLLHRAGELDPEPALVERLLDSARQEIDEEEIGASARRLNQNGTANLKTELREEGPQPRLRRERRKILRAWSLAQRIATSPDTAVLTPANPTLAAEVSSSQWAGGDRKPLTALEVLGLIGCGLAIVVGGYLVIVGIACAVSCASAEALLIALVAGLLIWGGIAGIRRITRSREVPAETTEDDWGADTLPD